MTQTFSASWYVDNAATGSRNGTSWANAWTNLNAITGISAGDTVYISGGSTSKTYLDPYWTPAGGTAGNPITYKIGQETGHSGLAIFDGNGVNLSFLYANIKNVKIDGEYEGQTRFLSTNCATTAIHCDGASDVWLNHIIVDGIVRFNPGTNITLSHLTVRSRALTSANIVWEVRRKASEPDAFTNNVIRNCHILMPCNDTTPSWGSDGIAGGRCTSVYSNIFEAWYYTDAGEAESGRHADGWQNLGNSMCAIYANKFQNIANYGIFWEPSGNVSNVWIYNNVFYNNDTLSHASEASVGVVFGQRTAGSTVSNVLVANNTFVDWFGRGAITMGDDPGESSTWAGVVVANNLTYNTGKAGSYASIDVSLNGGGTNGISILKNKAISGTRGTNVISPSQLVAAGGDNGVAFVSYSELSDSNDARLLSSDTAAIGYGLDLSVYFTTDADGNARGATWDLGAFEYINTLNIATNQARAQRLRGWRGF